MKAIYNSLTWLVVRSATHWEMPHLKLAQSVFAPKYNTVSLTTALASIAACAGVYEVAPPVLLLRKWNRTSLIEPQTQQRLLHLLIMLQADEMNCQANSKNMISSVSVQDTATTPWKVPPDQMSSIEVVTGVTESSVPFVGTCSTEHKQLQEVLSANLYKITHTGSWNTKDETKCGTLSDSEVLIIAATCTLLDAGCLLLPHALLLAELWPQLGCAFLCENHHMIHT